MGTNYYVHIVDDEGKAVRAAKTRVERIVNGDEKEKFPQYANQTLKLVLTFVEMNNRKPQKIKGMTCSSLPLDNEGQLDEEKWEERLSNFMNGVFPDFSLRKDNVVSLDRKRAEREYKKTQWSASLVTLREIHDDVMSRAAE